MRRLFALFLLVSLPFQAAWAIAATYCEHEAAPLAWHLGHHAHDHADDHAPADDDLPGAIDNDCGTCHATSPALPGVMTPVVLDSIACLAERPIPPPTTAQTPRPDRPNWQAPA